MHRKLLQVLFVLLVVSVSCCGQAIPRPSEEAARTTEEGAKLVRAGVALHDLRDYDGAIDKYKQVLKDNPRDAQALYELAYSYFGKKDYQKTVQTCLEGMKYHSPFLGHFYSQLGNTYDELGQPEKALAVYKEGAKQSPRDSMLPFNAGITYMRMGKTEEAQKSYGAALLLNPLHISSHFRLAEAFTRNRQNVQALLALSRFLVLEPESQRSAAAFQAIREIMVGNVKQNGNNNVTIFVNLAPKQKGVEDFSAVEMMLGISVAAENLAARKNRSEIENLVSAYTLACESLSRMKTVKKKELFASYFYVPYFAELSKSKYVEPFVYWMCLSSGLAGVREWLAQHKEQVDAFRDWDHRYQWKTGK